MTRSYRGWLILLMCLATMSGCAAPLNRAAVEPGLIMDDPEIDPAELLDQLVKAHNAERTEAELSSIALDKKLCAAAQRQAEDMAAQNKMDHQGSDGSNLPDRVKDAGYSYKRCGENIAWGQKSVEQVVEVWMKSPPHKKNILGEFTQMGAARAFSKDGTPYWCVVFATPLRT